MLNQSVISLMSERLPVTLLLSAYSLAIALIMAIPLSMLAATHRGTVLDHAGRFLGILGLAMPSFWLGLMLMMVFAVNLRWLPVSGYVGLGDPIGHFRHMILPSVALGAGYAAIVLETSRNSLIEVLRQDYIRTARASGLAELSVRWKYAMRNALIPTVTVIGIQVGYLMSGAVIIENVFAIPGLGRLLVNGVLTRDYPLVQACMLVVVLIFSLATLVVDLVNAVIDPRIAKAY
jgi:peptide/nickel transport system permease protein